MNREEFLKIWAYLAASYPNAPKIDKNVVSIWFAELKRYSMKSVYLAIRRYQRGKYGGRFPSLPDIRNRLSEPTDKTFKRAAKETHQLIEGETKLLEAGKTKTRLAWDSFNNERDRFEVDK